MVSILRVLLVLVGAGGLVAGIRMMSASRRARGWPVVPGRIVERGIRPSTTAGSSRAGRSFEPRVRYDYTVEGKAYTAERIGLIASAFNADTARRMADELPELVEVHHNPRDPADACLRPSGFGVSLVVAIGGLVGVLVGAGWFLASVLGTG